MFSLEPRPQSLVHLHDVCCPLNPKDIYRAEEMNLKDRTTSHQPNN